MRERVVAASQQIGGWMAADELGWLYDEASQCVSAVEIGVWLGRSSYAIASGVQSVMFAVDHWMGAKGQMTVNYSRQSTSDGRLAMVQEVYRNLWELIEAGKCVPLRIESSVAANWLPSVDMVFVDGGHDYDACKADIEAWLPKTRRIICGHDYNEPGVRKAVDELLPGAQCDVGQIWYRRI